MSKLRPTSIGFAAGILGELPLRIGILATGTGWIALNKPAGIAFEDHPWQNGVPTLLGQLRLQLASGKPELIQLGFTEPAAVFGPEPESAGIAILAERSSAMAAWRDAIGSGACRFEYELIARSDENTVNQSFICDLPIAMDDSLKRAFISHRFGKHAQTRFEPYLSGGNWSVWNAYSPYPRRDQIRIHAKELGIQIAGELKYGQAGRVLLTETTPRRRLNKGEDKPLHRGLLLRIASITGKVSGQFIEIRAPRPDDFATVVKRISTKR